MSRTVTAMFDSRSEAEAAKARLNASNIDADRIRIIDKSSSPSSNTGSFEASGDGQGFWASLKDMFVPDEDRHSYGEAINRGGFLLCADVDENEADEAVRILDQAGSVDFEQREQSFRSEGWNGRYSGADTGGFAGGTATGLTGATAAATDSFTGSNPNRDTFTTETAGQSFGTTGTSNYGERSNTVDEEHIPIVEEELRIGKREVNRGGARVRSYVREVPVHEQVTLREEHVSVERRPVNETLRAGDLGTTGDAFQERNIEMTETAEEAVVAKEARVKEELVVRKTAEEHVENVDDTVRRTEVDIDEGLRDGSSDRSAFGGFGTSGTATGATDRTDRTDTDLEGTNLQDRSRGF